MLARAPQLRLNDAVNMHHVVALAALTASCGAKVVFVDDDDSSTGAGDADTGASNATGGDTGTGGASAAGGSGATSSGGAGGGFQLVVHEGSDVRILITSQPLACTDPSGLPDFDPALCGLFALQLIMPPERLVVGPVETVTDPDVYAVLFVADFPGSDGICAQSKGGTQGTVHIDAVTPESVTVTLSDFDFNDVNGDGRFVDSAGTFTGPRCAQ
ncbi:MAG: hypothetical protein HOW73_46090 [Polyangiaceae bacterium]|nr:hypothetical protein [Polyangiaceae bacterium]